MMTTMAAMLGRAAAGDRLRRRRRIAPAARHLDRRRADRQPGADPLHDAGHLSLSRPLPAVGAAALAVRHPRLHAGQFPHPASECASNRWRRRRMSGGCARTPAPAGGRAGRLGRRCRALGLHGRARLPAARPPRCRPPTRRPRGGGKSAEPLDAIDRGAWWSIYNDPVLDGLERQIDISNQNLKAAEAAFRQAGRRSSRRPAPASFRPRPWTPARSARAAAAAAPERLWSVAAASAAGSATSSARRPRRAGRPICGVRFAAPSRAMSRARRPAPATSPARGCRRKGRSPATICNCASPTS